MHYIETTGSWREMGRQLGETFAEPLRVCIDHYCPWLSADPGRFTPAVQNVRESLQAHCPELLDETEGLAEGAGLHPNIAIGYCFFNDVRARMVEGCSVVYFAGGDSGPLLGRNCDLKGAFDTEAQMCRVRKPLDGCATIMTTYLGLAAGLGLNEHGLGLAGASAHTKLRYGDTGLPGQILQFMLLNRCKNVEEARALFAEHSFFGKSHNLMAGDAEGASVLFEMVPGRPAGQVDRREGTDWHVCTNFFVSGQIPISPEQEYLESAYARYGYASHQLEGRLVDRSVSGMQGLLTELAQPGRCIAERKDRSTTAYSQVMDLKSGTMRYTPGHPAEAGWELAELY